MSRVLAILVPFVGGVAASGHALSVESSKIPNTKGSVGFKVIARVRAPCDTKYAWIGSGNMGGSFPNCPGTAGDKIKCLDLTGTAGANFKKLVDGTTGITDATYAVQKAGVRVGTKGCKVPVPTTPTTTTTSASSDDSGDSNVSGNSNATTSTVTTTASSAATTNTTSTVTTSTTASSAGNDTNGTDRRMLSGNDTNDSNDTTTTGAPSEGTTTGAPSNGTDATPTAEATTAAATTAATTTAAASSGADVDSTVADPVVPSEGHFVQKVALSGTYDVASVYAVFEFESVVYCEEASGQRCAAAAHATINALNTADGEVSAVIDNTGVFMRNQKLDGSGNPVTGETEIISGTSRVRSNALQFEGRLKMTFNTGITVASPPTMAENGLFDVAGLLAQKPELEGTIKWSCNAVKEGELEVTTTYTNENCAAGRRLEAAPERRLLPTDIILSMNDVATSDLAAGSDFSATLKQNMADNLVAKLAVAKEAAVASGELSATELAAVDAVIGSVQAPVLQAPQILTVAGATMDAAVWKTLVVEGTGAVADFEAAKSSAEDLTVDSGSTSGASAVGPTLAAGAIAAIAVLLQ